MNQVIANRLKEVPHMKATDLTRNMGHLVKTLTELTAAYVKLAQVGVEKRIDVRMSNRLGWMNPTNKKKLCFWQFQEWKRKFVAVCVKMVILSQIVMFFAMSNY